MGIFSRLIERVGADLAPTVSGPPAYPVQAYATIDLLNDVGLPDFLRGGTNFSGATVNRQTVMRNPSVKRCVNLISNVAGMLPFHLMKKGADGTRDKAEAHDLHALLSTKPNTKQSAFQYRKLMQRWALVDGNAYSEIIRSRGRVTGLLPIHPTKVRRRQNWDDPYVVDTGRGTRTIQPVDMLHIYGDSDDGLNGVSLVDEAADAIGLSLQADKAAARLFRYGSLIRDVLSKKDGKLSKEAVERLKAQFDEEFSGSENANKTLVTEEGLEYKSVQTNAKDSQHLETRQHQIEEIARVFGVPRPFLMMDDTSWGSGIEQLGIFFVQYGLAPWFVAWEQAVERSLLTDAERRAGYYTKFNERALLRGSMKDQAEFFSKMMGAGGGPQIMEQNEARGLLDLPDHPEGVGLSKGSQGGANGTTGQDPA
jgi:HK97 family phage portal protein